MKASRPQDLELVMILKETLWASALKWSKYKDIFISTPKKEITLSNKRNRIKNTCYILLQQQITETEY